MGGVSLLRSEDNMERRLQMKVCLVCGEVIETLINTGCPYCGASSEEIAEEEDEDGRTDTRRP